MPTLPSHAKFMPNSELGYFVYRSVESSLYKGTPVLIRAVRKVLSSKETTRRQKCVLEISDKGIKMIDKSKGEVSAKRSGTN